MTDYLVIQAARFGDLIQTKRLILTLQAKGQVHLLLDKGLVALAKLIYPNIICYPFHFHGKIDLDSVAKNRQILQSLSCLHFEEIYNCNYSPMTSAICRMFESNILGYRPNFASDGGILKSPFLRLIRQMTINRKHSAINLVDVWAHLAQNPIDGTLVNPKPCRHGGGIGVVLSGQEERRSLPPAVLADLIQVYSAIYNNPKVYFLGTELEKPNAHQTRRHLSAAIQRNLEDLTGKTSWADLYSVVSSLDLLLTPDTGTMHLAAHLGIPIRAFFLSSALCHETGPYGAGHVVFQAAAPCVPCLEKASCTHNLECLSPFKTRELWRAITRFENGQSVDMPANLLCFVSDFDALGVSFRPLAGVDSMQAARTTQRAFIANYLHLDGLERLDCSEQDLAEIIDMFSQDLEWMLPNTRYA
ncbi:MAG: glycosyltransferase family 9 protein [Desulfovibrionaceae bacterium]|nr:glycosyltransferase family 9 protein [Desulfovibrionaceae bacterium]